MTEAMAAMLDELMGKQRNTVDKEQQQQKLHYDEPEVCKFALAGLCPYTLFNNTKSDLGMFAASLFYRLSQVQYICYGP
jgi:RNA-binding protein Luc7-like 2